MKRLGKEPQNFELSAVILLVSTVLVKVIGALFKIPLKNLIGPLGFGYFSSAYDLFLPIYALSMAGLPVAVSRLVAKNMADGHYKEARKTLSVAKKAFLTTGLAGLMVILLAIYPYIRLTTANRTDAVYVAVCIVAVAPSILFCCFMSAYRGYYEGTRNMYPTAVSDVIEALGKLILGLGFAYGILKLTGKVAFAAAGALAGIMIGTLAGYLYLSLRHCKVGDTISLQAYEASCESRSGKEILKALIAIAVPVVLSSLATNITLLIDTTMVKWQLKNVMASSYDTVAAMYAHAITDYNATAKELLNASNMPTFLYGIRGEAYTLYNLIPTLTTTLGIGAIPILTTVWVQGDRPGVKRNIDKILRTTALIAMPAGLGVLAISPYLMGLLYQDTASVEIGATLLSILGVAAVFSGISVPITSMLQAIGKPMVPVKNIAVGACLKIFVNALLVGRPAININGAPVGTTVCYAYIFFANLYCLIKYTGIRPSFGSTLIKPLLSAAVCALCAYGVSAALHRLGQGNLVIVAGSVIVAAVVYVIMIFVLRTLTAEDIADFPKGEKLVRMLQKAHIIA